MKFRASILFLLAGVVGSFLLIEDQTLLFIAVGIFSMVYGIALTVGVTTIKWNYFMKSVNRTPEGQICFTFDDGPHENTAEILAVLDKHNIKSTFFVIGRNCEKHPEILRLISEQGHLIGNHSYSHINKLGWSATSKIIEEIDRANEVVKSIIGVKPLLYRPPFGVTNPKIARAVATTKLISVGWSIRTFDTVIRDAKKIIEKVEPRLNKGGHIVLMHDSCPQTVIALDALIVDCKEKGIEIVNLDRIAR